MYALPRVSTLNVSRLPDALDGWVFVWQSDQTEYPVLYFGPYMYTALSSVNGDNRMKVVCWDSIDHIVKEMEFEGVQHIWRITFDAETQTVTFIGQSEQCIQLTLDDLVVHPTTILISHNAFPTLRIPPKLTYPSVNSFKGLRCGPYIFLPLSYTDGRNSICVAVVQNNLIERLIECPGIHTIRDISVDARDRTILLRGQDHSIANFDYNIALACYHCSYFITKDDFLFFARDLNYPLSYDDAVTLENTMPRFDWALSVETAFNIDSLPTAIDMKNTPGGATVCAILGGFLGGLCGFLVGGPGNSGLAAFCGTHVGMRIGEDIPSSSHPGQYKLSGQELVESLVVYAQFPCEPLYNLGVQENIFDFPFLRYQDQPYSAALIRPTRTSAAPRAYSPATRVVGPLPRDPRYNSFGRKNGTQIMKYIFVIIKTDETNHDGHPGYQMRINPDGFYVDLWPATQRVNHIQLSEGYRFWALVGHPETEVYAAGSLYIDATNQKLFGIDTRTGHYFRAFMDQDQQVYDATLDFLENLGYPTSGMKGYREILMSMQGYL